MKYKSLTSLLQAHPPAPLRAVVNQVNQGWLSRGFGIFRKYFNAVSRTAEWRKPGEIVIRKRFLLCQILNHFEGMSRFRDGAEFSRLKCEALGPYHGSEYKLWLALIISFKLTSKWFTKRSNEDPAEVKAEEKVIKKMSLKYPISARMLTVIFFRRRWWEND